MTHQTLPRAHLIYLGVACLLWALIPTLFFPNAPLDVIEGFAWGRELALGYTKHPPMQAWLLEASYWLTGGHTFGGYWLSAMCLAISYGCLYALGRRLGLSAARTGWGLLLTSVIFYFTLPVPEFNPNILQLPVWSAMILVTHRALDHGKLRDWALLGALAAIGLLTKYFVILLIGCIGLYALVFADARRHVLTPGPYIAFAVALLLLSPHLWWIYDTEAMTIRFAGSRSHGPTSWVDYLLNPLHFLSAQVGVHTGVFLVLVIGFGKKLASIKKATVATQDAANVSLTNRRFLLWFGFLPLTVSVLCSAFSGNEFEHMWGTPMFVLSGLLSSTFLPLSGPLYSRKRAFAAVVVIQGVFLGITLGQAVLEPLWKTKHTRIHYPGQQIATYLETEWRTQMQTPLSYVAGDMWATANITAYADSRPHMFYLHDTLLSPWIDLADVQQKGLMLVWRGDNPQLPDNLADLYPTLQQQGHHSFASPGGGKIPPVTVNWAIVPPGDVNMRKREGMPFR
ncbi:glycosyltransferase family 39 protein [Roseibium sp.]|uniref:glycosyltransferase family 39 protein n=1 Tax=Roseibium sp. TaxID=1936156 RepID=UPI003A9721D9